MSDNNEVERPLDRRLLLRGGAVLASAAGIAVAGAAMGPTAAHAADGDAALLGEDNASETTTSLTIGGSAGSSSPALAVSNPSGPVLKLSPVGQGYSGDLKLGELAVTRNGPEIGVYGGPGGLSQTTFLVTGLDLDQIPVSVPIDPERLLDTRTAQGRDGIRSASAGAVTTNGQIKAGGYIDVAIAPSEFAGLAAVYVNVTAVTPTTNGFIVVYPPGDRPGTSTLNFVKRQTIANSTFILSGVADEDEDWTVVRIYTSALTHILLDLTGVSLLGITSTGSAAAGTASQRKAVKANRVARVLPQR